jgi:uncharacterized membrane protein YuzA (DUF378 family)
MKYDRIFLFTLNVLARLFGGLAILASVMILVSAYAIQQNRIVNIIVGLAVGVMGIAFLVAKPVNPEKLATIRRRMGSN